MVKPNAQVVRDFNKLRSQEFDGVKSYLALILEDAKDAMVLTNDENQWRTLKGRAGLAKELLELIESSGELALKFNQQATR